MTMMRSGRLGRPGRLGAAMLALAVALGACSGGETAEDNAVAEPAPLELTPGSWAANDERTSFADEDGNMLATFRCDDETGELLLETPGGFPEGARRAMIVRVGDIMHGIDPVEVREEGDGQVRSGRIPARGTLMNALLGNPSPMTIETDGGEPMMLETDATLQGFVEQCGADDGGDLPAEDGQ